MEAPPQPPKAPGFLAYAQLIFGVLGFLGAGLVAVLLGIFGLALAAAASADPANITAVMTLAWISGLVAVLALPSVLYSFNELRPPGLPVWRPNWIRLARFLILLWPLVLVLGRLVSRLDNLAWLVLPPLQILAVGLPILWILSIVHNKLPAGSAQRSWGIINFSLFFTNPFVVFVEIVAFVLLVLVFIVYVMGQPELMRDLEQFAQNLSAQQSPDPDAILPLLRPYLQNPAVILGTLGILSVLVPLLEEFLKPLALLALSGKKLTPSAGFSAGAYCGAMFALLESLLSVAQPGDGWLAVAVGRAGTATLHITTTALIGWALATALQKGSYLKLLLVYLLASAVHGLWNAASVFSGFGALLQSEAGDAGILGVLSLAAPGILVFLTLGMLAVLWSMNRRLRGISSPPGPVSTNPNQSIDGVM